MVLLNLQILLQSQYRFCVPHHISEHEVSEPVKVVNNFEKIILKSNKRLMLSSTPENHTDMLFLFRDFLLQYLTVPPNFSKCVNVPSESYCYLILSPVNTIDCMKWKYIVVREYAKLVQKVACLLAYLLDLISQNINNEKTITLVCFQTYLAMHLSCLCVCVCVWQMFLAFKPYIMLQIVLQFDAALIKQM